MRSLQPPPGTLVFDRDGVRAVDREAVEDYGIPGVVLMENAARGLFDAALTILDQIDSSPSNERRSALVICGSGNNGGDGYALARHLHNARVEVTLAPLGEPDPSSDGGINRAVCRAMQLPEIDLQDISPLRSAGLIVDAIFGTGLDRPVTGRAAEIIRWMNESGRPILAADLPSGLDCNSGEALGLAVRAARTVTFVGWKAGFLNPSSRQFTGEIIVAGIGAPRELIEKHGRRTRY
jgi:NAD(P)H-hydrate epimerase